MRALLASPLFFFNDTATTEIYTLSLHDALPISALGTDHDIRIVREDIDNLAFTFIDVLTNEDRKSTRLNSSHSQISYAVFCLKKKKRLKYLRDPHHARLIGQVSLYHQVII